MFRMLHDAATMHSHEIGQSIWDLIIRSQKATRVLGVKITKGVRSKRGITVDYWLLRRAIEAALMDPSADYVHRGKRDANGEIMTTVAGKVITESEKEVLVRVIEAHARKKEVKNQYIKVMVSAAEKDTLKAMAGSEGLSVSAFVRLKCGLTHPDS